jgi:hypothetical protein
MLVLRIFPRVSLLTTVLLVLLASSFASAQDVVINWTDRGWYDLTGFHKPNNDNYSSGDNGCPFYDSCEADTRNYFVFDLSSVTLPIVSAKLALSIGWYESLDPTETFELHDVATPITKLWDGTDGLATYDDLGSGVVYGSGEVNDCGRAYGACSIGTVYEFPLNSSAITAMNSSHGLFAMGGSITSLDGLPNLEFAFAATNIYSISQLRLTLVPEPSTFCLLAIGAASLLGRRRAKSHG